MRIAVVSDIHGNLAALEVVATDIRRRGVDRVVNLGDSLSGPLLPRETATFLIASDWFSLAGNHERQLLESCPGRGGPSDEYAYSQLSETELAWVRTLRPFARFTDDLFLCHATPANDTDYLLESVHGSSTRPATPTEIGERTAGERATVIACGHTHVPRVVRAAGGQLFVNPGSVGLPAYTADHPHPHAVETGTPDARYAIIEQGDNGWAVTHHALPYDHQSMAALAAERSRPDWVRALLTGYVT